MLPLVLVGSLTTSLYDSIPLEFFLTGLVVAVDDSVLLLDHVEVLLPFRIPVSFSVAPPLLLPQILAAAFVALVAAAAAALTAVSQGSLATLPPGKIDRVFRPAVAGVPHLVLLIAPLSGLVAPGATPAGVASLLLHHAHLAQEFFVFLAPFHYQMHHPAVFFSSDP